MGNKRSRIDWEGDTVAVMVDMYCCNHDSHDGLCLKCAELLDCARKRLDKCHFQEGKTTCAKCPVHCFKCKSSEKMGHSRTEHFGLVRRSGEAL